MGVRQQIQAKVDRFRRGFIQEMRTFFRRFERTMVTKHLSGPTGPSSVSARTGDLRRSLRAIGPAIRGNVVTVGADIGLRGGTKGGTLAKIARAHERGALIRPVKAQWLTIPLAAAKTRAGVVRGGARSFGDRLFPIKSKKGNLLLVERLASGRIKPYFVLKKSVRLPARLNFRREFRLEVRNTRQRLRDLMRRTIGRRS